MEKPLKKNLQKSGTILEAFPNASFKIKLDEGEEVLGHISGKLRMFRIKILPGDRVTVEMSPYDNKRGRIIYRGR